MAEECGEAAEVDADDGPAVGVEADAGAAEVGVHRDSQREGRQKVGVEGHRAPCFLLLGRFSWPRSLLVEMRQGGTLGFEA